MEVDALQDWVGRREVVEDALSAETAYRMVASLDMSEGTLASGNLLPGWQWLYFNPVVEGSELDVDGHPKRGGFLPPTPLPRRMWAAGSMEVHRPLQLGQAAERVSTIQNVESKEGKSGHLVFVTVGHQFRQGGTTCLDEIQNIVYREAPEGEFPERRSSPGRDADWQEERIANEVLLFRYSALTFNAHRIHHDFAYAREVEGYPGLVVHGPLLATQLAGFAGERLGGSLKQFSFRAVQPLFCGEPYLLKGSKADGDFWIETLAGHEIMKAQAFL